MLAMLGAGTKPGIPARQGKEEESGASQQKVLDGKRRPPLFQVDEEAGDDALRQGDVSLLPCDETFVSIGGDNLTSLF